jgi:hypothetical protein
MKSVAALMSHTPDTAAPRPAKGARVGYTRVSTVSQTLDQQNAALQKAGGVTKTFSDTMSGARYERKVFAYATSGTRQRRCGCRTERISWR